jgi:hypothetical protein
MPISYLHGNIEDTLDMWVWILEKKSMLEVKFWSLLKFENWNIWKHEVEGDHLRNEHRLRRKEFWGLSQGCSKV